MGDEQDDADNEQGDAHAEKRKKEDSHDGQDETQDE